MGRTNVEVDDELGRARDRPLPAAEQRAAVDLALRRLAGEAMSRDEALATEGSGWSGDLGLLREPEDA
jgi:Arc/MetJ family transcription regulator